MAAPKRSRSERQRDLATIARLYIREGLKQHEIADRLGVSQQQISYDLLSLRKMWLKSALVDFNHARAEQLAKIDELERTYWEAWLSSCEGGGYTVAVAEQGKDKELEIAKTITRENTGTGNPAFLAGVERCVGMRNKMLGLDAPRLIEVVDEGFDQEEWKRKRDQRHAAALATLNDAEELENGEAQ